MNLPIINFASILPAIVLSLVGIAIMVADPFLGTASAVTQNRPMVVT